MYVTSNRGPLAVVEMAADERTVQAALSRLDNRLFLAREPDNRHGCYVWRVLHYVSDDRPALPVCDWRDERGKPLPLALNLVEKVKSQEGRGAAVLREVDEANAKLVAGIDREAEEIAEEVAREVATAHKRSGHFRSKNVAANARRQRKRDLERRQGWR